MRKVRDKNYTVVVGCGRLGATIANKISSSNEDVLVIDKDLNSFRKLSKLYGGLTETGDACDLDVLEKADISKATKVFAVTDSDNINILVALMAKRIFNISNVIVRIYDFDKKIAYDEYNIKTICPNDLAINEISNFL